MGIMMQPAVGGEVLEVVAGEVGGRARGRLEQHARHHQRGEDHRRALVDHHQLALRLRL